MTEIEPSAPLPERVSEGDVDSAHAHAGAIMGALAAAVARAEAAEATVERFDGAFRRARAGQMAAEAERDAALATLDKVRRVLDECESLEEHGAFISNDLYGITDHLRAALADPESARCPHVAPPGSRHEDEDCPCVDGGRCDS